MLHLYRLLLLFYPARFRRRFGAELVAVFAAGWADERRKGAARAVHYLAACAADAVINGLRERRAPQPFRPRPEKNSMLSTLTKDLSFAARMLFRQRGFSLVVILTLAVGIGATTAIFSVVDGVLLRPLPYRDPGQLAFVWTKLAWIGVPRAWMNGHHISILQDETRQFESFVALQENVTQLSGQGAPQQLVVGRTTTNLLDVLGVPPEIGRGFRAEDGRLGNENVAILGHALWEGQFGGDPGIVGRRITLGGQPVEVVGVMPRRFRFLIHTRFRRKIR